MSEPTSPRSTAFDTEALGYLEQLKAMARRLTGNRTEADDFVQEAYLRALQSSHQFTPGTNLRAWLRTILTNIASNHRRDRFRSRVHSSEAAMDRATAAWASPAASPEQLLLDDVMGDRLRCALEAMPKALRDAIWLRDVEGLSYAEIAARLRTPIGTVMSRISRGRGQLHKRLLADADGATNQGAGADDDLR